MNEQEINSFGMTKKEVDKVFHERAPKEAAKLVQQHIHWIDKGWCKICGRKIREEQ